MAFIKVVKNKSYFKRFQVKFRRRREGKTDYQQRRKLCIQAKNKYNAPKYRLVVRITNRDIICQIAYAKLKGDVVMASAYSHELPRYGIHTGLTNYSAAYATGLLIARRHLHKLKLHKKYPGKEEVTGEDWEYDHKTIEGARPFRCNLDIGLARTSTGARIFGAMKGACDGGLEIPHSDTRFAGYQTPEGEEAQLHPDVLRKYLFGGHVAEYMKLLKKSSPDKYKRQFSRYIEKGINPDELESIYQKAHAAIRADPVATAKPRNLRNKEKKALKEKGEKLPVKGKPKRYNRTKKSLAEFKARIHQKKTANQKKAA